MGLITAPSSLVDGYKPLTTAFKQIYKSLTAGEEDIYIHTLNTNQNIINTTGIAAGYLSTRTLWFNETLSSASGGHSDGYHYRYIYSLEKYKEPDHLISLDSGLISLTASSNQWSDKWLTHQISVSGSLEPSISGIMHATNYITSWSSHSFDGLSNMGMSGQVYDLDLSANIGSGAYIQHALSADGFAGATEAHCTVFDTNSISGIVKLGAIYDIDDIIIWRFKVTEDLQGLVNYSASAWFEYNDEVGIGGFDLSLSADLVTGERSSEIVSITSSQYAHSLLVADGTYGWDVIDGVYTIEIT